MRKFFVLAIALAFASAAVAKPADTQSAPPLLKPTPTQAEAAIWATRFLTHFHYKPTPLDGTTPEAALQPVETHSGVTLVDLRVPDHVLVVEIAPAGR